MPRRFSNSPTATWPEAPRPRPVSNVSRAPLRASFRQKGPAGSTSYSADFSSNESLSTASDRPTWSTHDQRFAVSGRHPIKDIEKVWGSATTKLNRSSEIPRSPFVRYLNQMEYRFTERHEGVPRWIRTLRV